MQLVSSPEVVLQDQSVSTRVRSLDLATSCVIARRDWRGVEVRLWMLRLCRQASRRRGYRRLLVAIDPETQRLFPPRVYFSSVNWVDYCAATNDSEWRTALGRTSLRLFRSDYRSVSGRFNGLDWFRRSVPIRI